MTTDWRRKRNRLEANVYAGPNAYLVTVATEGRICRFTDANVVSFCVEKLIECAEVERLEVPAYVFMPDHCRLLLVGSDQAHLPNFMKRFKQVTAFWFKKTTGGALWQKSYHDHVLRREEAIENVAAYIAQNPVRAALVNEWEEYAYTGGSIIDGLRSGDLKVAAMATTRERQRAVVRQR